MSTKNQTRTYRVEHSCNAAHLCIGGCRKQTQKYYYYPLPFQEILWYTPNIERPKNDKSAYTRKRCAMKKYTICILSLIIAVLFSSCTGVSTAKVPEAYLTITNNPEGYFAPLSGSRKKVEVLGDLLRTYPPAQEVC